MLVPPRSTPMMNFSRLVRAMVCGCGVSETVI
jgi:hypothetical protein